MALIALFVRDRGLGAACARILAPTDRVELEPSWDGMLERVRERPVVTALVDLAAFGGRDFECPLRTLRSRFPSVSVAVIARRADDPAALFRLGRIGIPGLVLRPVDHLRSALPEQVARSRSGDTRAVVLRALSPHVPRAELTVVGRALDEVHRGWSANDFAVRVGLSRPHLSERLKAVGLPSTGHLRIWAGLLHAGRWLPDPGRTGQSVARQLGYNDGSAFRRALRSYVGATPTAVVERGGLTVVLDRFMSRCGYSEPGERTRVSVA